MESEFSISSLSQKKISQLRSSTIVPHMYIHIEKYDLDPSVNAVLYEIEVGIQKKDTVLIKKIFKRYSDLKQFDDQIRPLFNDNRFLKLFPPKKFFGNKSKEFLDQRAEQLQDYLTNLVRVAGMNNTPPFLRCFEIPTDSLDDF